MKRGQLERLSIRTLLAIGFCATFGLWLYTGYAFTQRVEMGQRNATELTTRYASAQELLSTVRAQVLLSSVNIRDALLNPQPRELADHRQQIATSYRIIDMALEDYEPVIGPGGQDVQMERLLQEVEKFHSTCMRVLDDVAEPSPAAIRHVLDRLIGPRREAALAISDEIQVLNRRAFIQQQSDFAEIRRVAERESRQELGIALIVGLGTLLLTSIYAGTLEGRLRQQMERDARVSRELQETAAKVITAQEAERRTIARELHDEVGQVFTAIGLELDVAQRTIENRSAGPETLARVQAIAEGAIRTVRNQSQLLHPAALDDLGLPAAIDASLRGLTRRYQIRAELQQVDLPDRLPHEVELAAYRIIQEAITNVGKHSRATHCQVRLTQLIDRLLVEVEDDGVGFIEDIDRPIAERGLGLVSVRARTNRLGGTFNILSAPGQGTRIIVSLPERGSLA